MRWLWQRSARVTMFRGAHASGGGRVSQSFVQLTGYVVLAAIILAVGFGAI